jgi:hypothetical protein
MRYISKNSGQNLIDFSKVLELKNNQEFNLKFGKNIDNGDILI